MADYELVYFLYEDINSLQTTVINFVAVLFAFLIAAYLAADKLESTMVFIVVALFTLVTVQQSVNAVGVLGLSHGWIPRMARYRLGYAGHLQRPKMDG